MERGHRHHLYFGSEMIFELTGYQKQILLLTCEGLREWEIAKTLAISSSAVHKTKVRILQRLNANNSVHAAVIALKTGMISLEQVTGKLWGADIARTQ